MRLKVEICGSCLRGCEIASTSIEKEGIAQRLMKDLSNLETGLDIEIEIGQCQRFCPEQRVTLSFSKEENESDRRLGASPLGTYDSILEFIASRARLFLAK